MKFLRWFFGLFSPYANSFEWRVNSFFKHIKSTDSFGSVNKNLLKLMQENLMIVNVWLEKKFKGYLYLKKSVRKQMYSDALKIVAKFDDYLKNNFPAAEELKSLLSAKGFSMPSYELEKWLYLLGIMKFLQPGKYYRYIKTASFGKLLRDPDIDKLEGDCNQIVTFYVYLYSLRYPISDLQIKLLPEHVCLHFRGVDIEATNGEFYRYDKDDQVLPITEIISTNLLDLSDFREDVQEISEREFLKSAQLAYAISSLKSLVEKNLKIGYRNLAVASLKSNHFSAAIFFAEKLCELDAVEKEGLLNTVYRNATVHYLNAKDFKKAEFYAKKSHDLSLLKSVRQNYAAYFYEKSDFKSALAIYNELGDEKMKKACYGSMYNLLAKKVANVKTLDDARKSKDVYRKMLDLALKMGDEGLESGVRKILGQI